MGPTPSWCAGAHLGLDHLASRSGIRLHTLSRLIPDRISKELWNRLAPIINKPASRHQKCISVALAQHSCVMRGIDIASFEPHQLLAEDNAIENTCRIGATWALTVTTHHLESTARRHPKTDLWAIRDSNP